MKYLIWSKEHQAWWKLRKNQSKLEYTTSLDKASTFKYETAIGLVENANYHLSPHDEQEEYIIPAATVGALLINFDATQMLWLEQIAKKLAD